MAIDGPSGAGKSTLARHLSAVATSRGLRVEVLHLDDLLDGWTGLASAIDAVERQVLSRLDQGRRLHHRRYDWHRGHFGTPGTVDPCDVLVLEGVGAGARSLAPSVDLTVWVDADDAERRTRALERDGDDYAPWYETWAAQERAHHTSEQTRRRADLTFFT